MVLCGGFSESKPAANDAHVLSIVDGVKAEVEAALGRTCSVFSAISFEHQALIFFFAHSHFLFMHSCK